MLQLLLNGFNQASSQETTIVNYAFRHCVSKCKKMWEGEFACSSCYREPQGFRAQCADARKTTFEDDRLRGERLIYDRRQLACDLSRNNLNTDYKYKHDGFETN
jgi:hypothetical protein